MYIHTGTCTHNTNYTCTDAHILTQTWYAHWITCCITKPEAVTHSCFVKLMDKLIVNFPPNEGIHKKLTNISNLTEVWSYYPMYCYAFIIMISNCCRRLNHNSSIWCSNQISCFAEGGFCLPLKEVCFIWWDANINLSDERLWLVRLFMSYNISCSSVNTLKVLLVSKCWL